MPHVRIKLAVLCTFVRVDDTCMTGAAKPYRGLRRSAFVGRRADMPAYMHHHDIETAPVICPGCIGLLPMFVREVEPHWSMAKIDFIYECSDCGAEVRHTVRKPELQH
jgi:hypothetical protein